MIKKPAHKTRKSPPKATKPKTTVIIPPTTDERPPKFYGKTQEAVNLIINHGVDDKTALVLTGCKAAHDTGALSRFRKKVSKLLVAQPKRVRSAMQALDDTLRMVPITYDASRPVAGVGKVDYTETIMPSITNRLAAAAMVLDRADPIIKHNVNLNVNTDISPVDLSEYGCPDDNT